MEAIALRVKAIAIRFLLLLGWSWSPSCSYLMLFDAMSLRRSARVFLLVLPCGAYDASLGFHIPYNQVGQQQEALRGISLYLWPLVSRTVALSGTQRALQLRKVRTYLVNNFFILRHQCLGQIKDPTYCFCSVVWAFRGMLAGMITPVACCLLHQRFGIVA